MSPREWIHAVGNGPFIGAMVFIVAITAASLLFARCCVGDRGFMRTGYDFEGYVIRKFAVCVGTGLPKRTRPRVNETGPPEVQVHVVEEVRASEPPAPPASPATVAAPAPPPLADAAAPVPVPVPVPTPAVAAAAGEEEDEDEEEEDDDDDDEFLFEE